MTESRDIAEVPALEVVGTAAVHLMSAAAVHLGLAEDLPDHVDLDEARTLIEALAGRQLARVLGSSVTSGEPWRSLWRPGQLAAVLAEYGLRVVSDDSLLALAHSLGSRTRVRASLRSGRVAVAEGR